MNGIVSFYEKPGCQGNSRQKVLLKDAGYHLQVIDLLAKTWDCETLMQFFGNLPMHQCVNRRAPMITSGELDVDQLSETELLDKMVAFPILIKRPLLFYRGRFGVGFDCELVAELLGEAQPDTQCQKNDSCTHA